MKSGIVLTHKISSLLISIVYVFYGVFCIQPYSIFIEIWYILHTFLWRRCVIQFNLDYVVLFSCSHGGLLRFVIHKHRRVFVTFQKNIGWKGCPRILFRRHFLCTSEQTRVESGTQTITKYTHYQPKCKNPQIWLFDRLLMICRRHTPHFSGYLICKVFEPMGIMDVLRWCYFVQCIKVRCRM